MSEMTSRECVERFIESMKKASSRCREMKAMTGNPMWGQIATSLDGMRAKGVNIIEKQSLTQQEISKTIDLYKGQLAEKQDNETPRHTH